MHHIRKLLPAKVAGVQELRLIVEENKNAFDQGLFRILQEGELSIQVGLSRQASVTADSLHSASPQLRYRVEQFKSNTLASLHGAIRLVLESIAVLRKATSDVGWKEEDSRTQAIFATMCSLADKAQAPSASSMAVY